MVTSNETRSEKLEKVLKLNEQLTAVKKMKKGMLEDYKDQIDGIQDELNELVSELKGTDVA